MALGTNCKKYLPNTAGGFFPDYLRKIKEKLNVNLFLRTLIPVFIHIRHIVQILFIISQLLFLEIRSLFFVNTVCILYSLLSECNTFRNILFGYFCYTWFVFTELSSLVMGYLGTVNEKLSILSQIMRTSFCNSITT